MWKSWEERIHHLSKNVFEVKLRFQVSVGRMFEHMSKVESINDRMSFDQLLIH